MDCSGSSREISEGKEKIEAWKEETTVWEDREGYGGRSRRELGQGLCRSAIARALGSSLADDDDDDDV